MEHLVLLDYRKNPNDKLVFIPSQPVLRVNQDDTIVFKLGNAPDNGVFRLEFQSDRDKFAGAKIKENGQIESGDGPVRVTQKAAPGKEIKVHYSCRLFVNGKEQANDGGAGDVVIGDGANG